MTPLQPLACPVLKSLEQFSKGLLSEAELESVEAHLDTCIDCLNNLEQLSSGDLFVETVKASAGKEFPLRPAWIRVIDQAVGLSLGISHGPENNSQSHLWPTPEALDISQFLAPPQQPGEIGRIDQFGILNIIGKGGMGLVLRAVDSSLNRQLALKIMLPQNSARSNLLLLFEREAQALAAVHSDHVVKVFSVGKFQTSSGLAPYLAMELLQGETLADRLLTGRIPIDHLVDISQQLCLGLMDVHAKQLVHRDIKPGNIWLEWRPPSTARFSAQWSTERVKLLDFGLVQSELLAPGVTQSGVAMGTPAYMAPEQAAGKRVDHRSDLFSLGAVLYEMATGRSAFTGPHVVAVIVSATLDEPLDAASFNPALPNRLCLLIHQLLSKCPDARPASAIAVWEELKKIQNELSQERGRPPSFKSWWKSPWIFSALTAISCVVGWLMLQHVQIETPHGTLVVESTDPDIQIRITRGNTTIFDRTTERKFKLDVGQYRINLVNPPDNFDLSADRITMTRNGQRKVTIRLVPNNTRVPNNTPMKNNPASLKAATIGMSRWYNWPEDAPEPAVSPFTDIQAKAHQHAWAKYLNLDVEYTNSVGMKFVLIPPGEFIMGSTSREIERFLELVHPTEKYWQDFATSEAPQHKVILTQPFYLGVHEVTQANYEQIMGTNPSSFSPVGTGTRRITGVDTANLPVETVCWKDAAEFCAKLSQREKLRKFNISAGAAMTPHDRMVYRLPTEAEWEFGCRAGTTTRFWSGDEDEDLLQVGWFGANSGGRTHVVGELPANPFGLHDMHGNPWEWVQDWWDPNYYGQFQDRPAINPLGPTISGSQYVMRGGGWYRSASECLASRRGGGIPTHRHDFIGFRVSLVLFTVEAISH